MEILQGLLDNLTALLAAHPLAGEWYMAFVRFLFPALAVLILYRAVRSLLRIPHTPENWGQLSLPNGTSLPLTHWENILGRSKTADIYLNYPSISRQHAALCRGEDENWTLYDLGSKGGTAVNGEKVASSVPVKLGDTITLGGVPLIFLPQTVAEREEQEAKRRAERPAAIWPSFLWLTVFQVLACLQLLVAAGTEATIAIPLAFLGLTVLMWLYYAALRATRCVGFEMETIAFFLSTLSLSITASSAQSSLFKQFLAILLGLALFLVLGLFLRDLSRVQKNRWLMAAAAIGLLGITLVIGNSKYGAVNWISIGGMSFQPSEIAKICYIFAGAATLERLFHKRNLTLFIVLTGVCIGLLGLMSDFGTAAIFFVTFLVIAYMRSGDFATLSLICGGAVFGAGIILKFKPYILSRFASWGHAWEAASTTGYQQTRTMSAAASGGLLGMGAGNGWLHNVAAADTDLVFGMLCEEWGLIIALLAVFDIPLEKYNIGGDFIKLMLGPVTAVLALNIYRQRKILREHFLPVLAGCLAGSVVSLLSVLALCQVFQMEDLLTASLLPKSVTTAIAVGIAAASRGSLPLLWQWPVSPVRYAPPCLPSGSASPTRWRRDWPSALAAMPWGPPRPWRSASSRAP